MQKIEDEKEKNKEKNDKIYAEIKQDWKLTDKIAVNFFKINIEEYKHKNNYENKIDEQMLFGIYMKIINEFFDGFYYYLGKFGTDVIPKVMEDFVNCSIFEEAKRRVKIKNSKKKGGK